MVAHTILIRTPNTHAPNKVYIKAHQDATISVELIVYKGKFADPVTRVQRLVEHRPVR